MNATQVVWLVFGLLGASCVGSFTNVVIDRLPRHLDAPNEYGEEWETNTWRHVLGGESRCSSCGVGLRARDMIPVLSWFLLRGRCRQCGERIPAYHPFVELLVPALGAAVWLSLGWGWRTLPVLLMIPVVVAIAVIDLQVFMVPTRIVWPAFGLLVAVSVLAAVCAHQPRWLLGGLIGTAVLAGPLLLLWIAIPSGMGFGDVRLAVLVGWAVGFATANTRPVTSAFGALVCLVGAAAVGIVFGFVAMGARGLKARIPFGPPLVAATLLCLAFAPQLSAAFKA